MGVLGRSSCSDGGALRLFRRVLHPGALQPREEPQHHEQRHGVTGQRSCPPAASWRPGTLLSRMTGFVRASLLGAAIGIALHGEVFNVANTIPNSLYILVAGGVFNTVLVPQLVRAIKNDPDGGDAYANRIITPRRRSCSPASRPSWSSSPQCCCSSLVDGNWFTDPSSPPSASRLIAFARWCLPQIFFYGMFVLLGQILNARGRFGPMMWAPIANNLISIGVIVAYIVVYAGDPTTGGYTTGQEVLARARLDARHRRADC